jgi:hypothetical protein
MKYVVIYEKSKSGWGAYVPDFPVWEWQDRLLMK